MKPLLLSIPQEYQLDISKQILSLIRAKSFVVATLSKQFWKSSSEIFSIKKIKRMKKRIRASFSSVISIVFKATDNGIEKARNRIIS